jgi:ribosome biogenesis GTPase
MRGLIIRAQSGFFTVQTDSQPPELLDCHLRGRLKKGKRLGDLAAIGDRVEITRSGPNTGMIEAILRREHMLARMAPTPQGEYQQILIANPDQAVFVFACSEPAPRLGMLDRFLVIAEKAGIPALVVANKLDLLDLPAAQALFGHFPNLGYTVLYTSTKNGAGIEALRLQLTGKLSVFAGPSGVGKSSLLNAIQPGLGLASKEVSQATHKGRHATVVRQLFPLSFGGFVADTPGLKALAFWDIQPEELDGYFPEMRSLVAHCQFSDCTHAHEPGCSVRQALNAGHIHPQRYQSYLRMRFGEEQIEAILNPTIQE